MNLKKPNISGAFRKKTKIISFRIGDDESEELNTILKYTGVPARSQSSVLRLAIPFIHRFIKDGMALGAADVGQDKPFRLPVLNRPEQAALYDTNVAYAKAGPVDGVIGQVLEPDPYLLSCVGG